MSKISFFMSIMHNFQGLDVEVDADVTLGPGGPDPSEAVIMSVKTLGGDEISGSLSELVVEAIEEEAFNRAYERLHDGDD